MLPEGYRILHQPRTGHIEGGTAVIHNLLVDQVSDNTTKLTSAEMMECKICTQQATTHPLCVYRPPNKSAPVFLEELQVEEILSIRSTNTRHLFVVGDVNLHMDKQNNVHVKRLQEVLSVFTMKQIVKEPTHKNGHTLDVVVYTEQMQISGVNVSDISDNTTYDHYAVFIDI